MGSLRGVRVWRGAGGTSNQTSTQPPPRALRLRQQTLNQAHLFFGGGGRNPTYPMVSSPRHEGVGRRRYRLALRRAARAITDGANANAQSRPGPGVRRSHASKPPRPKSLWLPTATVDPATGPCPTYADGRQKLYDLARSFRAQTQLATCIRHNLSRAFGPQHTFLSFETPFVFLCVCLPALISIFCASRTDMCGAAAVSVP